MTSNRQIEANRVNATRSSGPRTSRGKALSSRNSLRHGLSCAGAADDAAVGLDDLIAIDGSVHDAVAMVHSQVQLRRVRAARLLAFKQLLIAPDQKLLRQLRGLDRYERNALASLRKLARANGR